MLIHSLPSFFVPTCVLSWRIPISSPFGLVWILQTFKGSNQKLASVRRVEDVVDFA